MLETHHHYTNPGGAHLRPCDIRDAPPARAKSGPRQTLSVPSPRERANYSRCTYIRAREHNGNIAGVGTVSIDPHAITLTKTCSTGAKGQERRLTLGLPTGLGRQTDAIAEGASPVRIEDLLTYVSRTYQLQSVTFSINVSLHHQFPSN